ncbi:MAG: BrnT family toxin [Alphaproteobacteria bacterium]|nr:BrnT family toxin [Alphaproteobacteria bacterium]MDE2112889.1 BrnT family toxin [Alphaproteobacteria bacterium]MDE2495297.1 BrnT family toxin [Alphaproteobacteria bacterium]
MSGELRFEWDARKAASNKRKHGVSFESAALIFDDPQICELEEGNDHGEIRYRAIGEALGQLLFVSYTSFEETGEEVVRIISARKAEPKERRAYQRHAENYR